MKKLAKQNERIIPMNDDFPWDNGDNNAFYEAVAAEGLQKIAEEKAGLADGCDLKLLAPYWSEAHSILEVGAGYARAIDYLFSHGFKGSITAIERCQALYQFLTAKFKNISEKKLRILQCDIRDCDPLPDRYDLILLLWSTLVDFSPEEQPVIIEKLARLLKQNGKLAIDTVPGDQKFYSFRANGSTAFFYTPNVKQIEEYAKKAGFSTIKHITYYTLTQRKRWLFILS